MSVRTSMADLISRTRTLIADPSSAQFTDQQVQDALDFRRTEVRYAGLRPQPTYAPGNSITYLDYYSDAQNWEGDCVLQDLSYNTLSPSLSEYIVGHWQFSSQPNGIGVRITGKVYDVYGAAADLLDDWAAALKLDFNFVTDSETFSRQQKLQMCVELAAKYRALAQARPSRMVVGDDNPDWDGGGIVYPNIGGGRDYA